MDLIRLSLAEFSLWRTSTKGYYDLIANPEATVVLGSERFRVKAAVTVGEERQRLFNRQAQQTPVFAEYRQKTTRQVLPLKRHGRTSVAICSVAPKAYSLARRSPGWQWCGKKNVLPGTQRHMLGFVKLGASRTFVARSKA